MCLNLILFAGMRYFDNLISDPQCPHKDASFDMFFEIDRQTFQSPTKVRYPVSPKCEKFRQI